MLEVCYKTRRNCEYENKTATHARHFRNSYRSSETAHTYIQNTVLGFEILLMVDRLCVIVAIDHVFASGAVVGRATTHE